MDQPGPDAFGKAAIWLGGGGVAAGLGVFLKGFFTGTTQQEKEMRDSLAARVETLETRLDDLEKRLAAMTRGRDSWRHLCLDARLTAREMAVKAGETLPGWPDDPKEE